MKNKPTQRRQGAKTQRKLLEIFASLRLRVFALKPALLFLTAIFLLSGSVKFPENEFEMKARKRLVLLSKKTNKLLLAISVLAGLNVIGFSALAYMIYRSRTRIKEKEHSN